MDKTIDQILENFPQGKRDCLIPILQEIQNRIGFLSTESMEQVSKHVNIPSNKILGVATFYNQFRFHPLGKYHFQICRGSSCHLATGNSLLKELEKLLQVKQGNSTRDGKFSLEVVTCLGACENAPSMLVNGEAFTHLSLESLNQIVTNYKAK
jgi:NADH-quinone oxidoreductase E subunit